METPLSSKRLTRSQTKALLSKTTNIISSRNIEEKPNQRTCLIDITNGSPIVGLASTNLSETPVSSFTKQNKINFCKKTPGSGEALLRGQVKNLLQKVEEVADISKFLSFDTVGGGRHGLKAFLNSPAGLLAPTPTNTPQVLNFNNALDEFDSLGSVLESPIEDKLIVSKVVKGKIDGSESEKDIISRSLFLNFSEKSNSSSVEKGSQKKSPSKDDDEDDDASIWSIQVNASTRGEDENEDEEEMVEENDISSEDGETKSNMEQLEELCEGIKKIGLMGKHIRFEYNSDDELIVEEEVLHLKGLPTPKGKHLRFQDEDDE